MRGKSMLPYAMALAYALTKDLKGSAVEQPSKARKPTFTERRKAEEAKRRQRK